MKLRVDVGVRVCVCACVQGGIVLGGLSLHGIFGVCVRERVRVCACVCVCAGEGRA